MTVPHDAAHQAEHRVPPPVRRERTGLFVGLVSGGAVVVWGAGLAILAAVWGPDPGPRPAQAESSVAQPEPSRSAEEPGDPAAGGRAEGEVTDDEPADERAEPEKAEPAWLEEEYRVGAEMDPASGPSLAPMSWEFYGDNDWTVNDYPLSLAARQDVACDALPQVPALTQGVADDCVQGFAVRVVSRQGPQVAADLVVVEVGSEEVADEIVAAYDRAAGSGSELADASGAAGAALQVAPPPGYEDSYAVLDDGSGTPILHATGSVVVLVRLGDTTAAHSGPATELASAALFVVADHEVAQLFG
ncbi:hypothetical protein [Cellulosimicrobium sp. Marseille-Q4280]|uniref:hypothetical protein n=1 Tax=Cellulosimicrobium sp. Marseille-Q4280 TaxID=2937992 RepID=UPI002042294C|nr:hypothetical protein [Cellulosimicrobium sp. Marseille-Q4280]